MSNNTVDANSNTGPNTIFESLDRIKHEKELLELSKREAELAKREAELAEREAKLKSAEDNLKTSSPPKKKRTRIGVCVQNGDRTSQPYYMLDFLWSDKCQYTYDYIINQIVDECKLDTSNFSDITLYCKPSIHSDTSFCIIDDDSLKQAMEYMMTHYPSCFILSNIVPLRESDVCVRLRSSYGLKCSIFLEQPLKYSAIIDIIRNDTKSQDIIKLHGTTINNTEFSVFDDRSLNELYQHCVSNGQNFVCLHYTLKNK